MVAFGRRITADKTRRSAKLDDATWEKSEFLAPTGPDAHGAAAFLIEQHAKSVIPAHFHRENQFQLFINGSGLIGGHTVAPVTIHYAGACTGYGPIVAGDAGLSYMTLRASHDKGAVLLRDTKPPKGPKRGATVGPIDIPDVAELQGIVGAVVHELVKPTAEGLAVWLHALGPGASLHPKLSDLGQGRFLVVASGSVSVEGEALELWESIYVASGENWPALAAQDAGAAILQLVVPLRDPRFADVASQLRVTVA